MDERRIPVVVLAGFLGSGKTTVLNHLLRNRAGVRIGAVVNDFGSIPVDALAVAGQVDALASFDNGCLCCANDTEELDRALELLTRPAADIDLIVVEASGLAEPATLVRMVLGAEEPAVTYGGLVEVVDAAEFAATRARHPELDRHVALADLVVLNKADRVAPAEVDEALATLRELAGRTPVVAAAHGRVDLGLFFDAEAVTPRRARARQLSFADLANGEAPDGAWDAVHPHLHAAYQSVAFTAAEPLDPGRLMRFLGTRPAGVYRIKGEIDFGPDAQGRRYTVHAVGDFLRFTPEPWPPGRAPATRLVLIGADIDADGLRADLASCVAGVPGPSLPGPTTPEPAERESAAAPRSMWEVLRYVEERPADGAERPADGADDGADGAEDGPERPAATSHAADPAPHGAG